MKKLDEILGKLTKEPTLYDYHSLTKEWSISDLNVLMKGEFTERIQEIANELQRTEYAVILKYLEVRNDVDEKLAYDVRVIEGPVQESEMYQFEDWNIEDFAQGLSVVHMNVGDMIEVNVRLLSDDIRNTPPTSLTHRLAHFMIVPNVGGAIGGLFGGARHDILEMPPSNIDPDRWGLLRYLPSQPGLLQIGMEIKEEDDSPVGIKKTILINVNAKK